MSANSKLLASFYCLIWYSFLVLTNVTTLRLTPMLQDVDGYHLAPEQLNSKHREKESRLYEYDFREEKGIGGCKDPKRDIMLERSQGYRMTMRASDGVIANCSRLFFRWYGFARKQLRLPACHLRVVNLLPRDQRILVIKDCDMRVAAVGPSRFGDPIDLAIATGSTNLACRFLSDLALLVAEHGHCYTSSIGMVVRVKMYDVELAKRASPDVLVRYLDATGRHTLGLSVEPDSTLIFGADAGVGRLVCSFERNTSVVGASPRASCAVDLALGISSVVSDNKISTVQLGFIGPDKIAVQVRRHCQPSIRMDIWPTKPGPPLLLSINITIDSWDGSATWRSVANTRIHSLVSKKCKPMIMSYKTSGFLHIWDRDIGA
ncbi:hypothetical protein KC328_g68 [Hortaea werneckii]|nr:hypothetical protein KC328_g68 [Hortaea werneckii]